VEALLSLGNVELANGNFAAARDTYREALDALGDEHQEMRARIERDLTLLAETEAKRGGTRAA
jgi:hypothetical protein